MAVKVLSSKSLYQQRSSKRVEVLPDEQVVNLKRQLSRSIVMFLELLHTLLIKNRELLLAWVARKRALKAEEGEREERGEGLEQFREEYVLDDDIFKTMRTSLNTATSTYKRKKSVMRRLQKLLLMRQ
ncbi:hypothetical protein TL16_g07579 [Triparma laevis f. inornata]|uniref:Uncharacterized protein n=1 Tax=Triparma laevis f. inornata TaxID=1714386 RepID=A0A9W7EE48_9STRA|nr:hypothetical protein TL16_g07579 [Triparma laevis f. inornata]